MNQATEQQLEKTLAALERLFNILAIVADRVNTMLIREAERDRTGRG